MLDCCNFEMPRYDVVEFNLDRAVDIMKNFGFLIASFLLIGAFAPFAQASDTQMLSRHGGWEAHVFTENGNRVCFMASPPQKKEGNYTSRGEPFALVTHRPADNTRDVFSYITGYPYKAGSTVSVKIDDQEFSLITQDETAWAPDADMDRKLARAIQDGSEMIIQGTSSRGTLTTDTISLTGSSAAYKRMSEACGY